MRSAPLIDEQLPGYDVGVAERVTADEGPRATFAVTAATDFATVRAADRPQPRVLLPA